jgi:hypothetical protein
MQLGFVDILVVFLSLGISLLIVVPLTGVLIRFRANYNPKALQLDAEGGAAPHTGPVVNSYFAMMARVWRIEVRYPVGRSTNHGLLRSMLGNCWSLQGFECV